MVSFKELNNQLFKFTYRDNIILIRLHKVMKTFINTKNNHTFFINRRSFYPEHVKIIKYPSERVHIQTTRCGHSHFCSIFAPRNRLTAFIFGEVTSYHKVRPAPDIHPVLGRDYLVHPHTRGERGHYGTLPSIQNQPPALAGRGRDHPNPRPLHHIGNSFAGTDRAVLLHPLGRIGHSPHHTPAPAADRGWHPAARTTLLCLLNKSCFSTTNGTTRWRHSHRYAPLRPVLATEDYSPCSRGLESLQ